MEIETDSGKKLLEASRKAVIATRELGVVLSKLTTEQKDKYCPICGCLILNTAGNCSRCGF